MKKRWTLIGSCLLVIFVLISLLVSSVGAMGRSTSTPTTTAPDGKTYLHQIKDCPINPVSYYDSEESFVYDPKIPVIGSEGIFWHFIDTYGQGWAAYFKFSDKSGKEFAVGPVYPYKVNPSMSHYGVITPEGYKLIDAYLLGEYPVDSSYKFNLSHTYYETHETTTGTTKCTTVPTTSQTTVPTTTGTTIPTTKHTTIPTTTETTVPTTSQTTTGTTVPTTTNTTQETTVPTTSQTTQGTTTGTTTEHTTTSTTQGTTVPTTSVTTSVTTSTMTTSTTDIPKTGESDAEQMWQLIGAAIILLAITLGILIHRFDKKNKAKE